MDANAKARARNPALLGLFWVIATAPVPSAPLTEPLQAVPVTLKLDSARARLGKQLFNDPRLSATARETGFPVRRVSGG
jgi:cytochrome c peroxidase